MALDRVLQSARSRPARPLVLRRARALQSPLAVLLGGALGLFSAYGDSAEAPAVVHWLANVPGPWVLLAFLIGAVLGSRVLGALVATLSLVTGVVTYYSFLYLSGQRPWLDTVEHALIVWTVIAVLTGIVFGVAGGSWRTGTPLERALAAALVVGVLLAECCIVAAETGPGRLRAMILSEAAVASVLLFALVHGVRGRAVAFVLTAGTTAVSIVALVAFAGRLHSAGL